MKKKKKKKNFAVLENIILWRVQPVLLKSSLEPRFTIWLVEFELFDYMFSAWFAKEVFR